MPRKFNYGLDYDEDYSTYEDYANEDYYDYGANDARSSQLDKGVSKSGLWRCGICTYDNDDGLSYCEICGVIRDSGGDATNNARGKVFRAVHEISGTPGASILAKSLFAHNSNGTPKEAVLSDDLLGKEIDKLYGKGINQARFDVLQKILMAQQNHSIKIVQFQFDTPSPDDIVSTGKNWSRKSKADSVASSSTKSPTTNTGKKGKAKNIICNGVSEGENSPGPSGSYTSSSESSIVSSKVETEGAIASENDDATKILVTNVEKLTLGRSSISRNRSTPSVEYKLEKLMLADQESDTHRQLNLAIVGHVDSGKSTLSGRLLHLLGRISKKEMHKYEKEAKEKGKGSFAYAWAMDVSTEERERGVTMTVSVAYFDTKRFHVVLLDSPGHKDFVPNMISGATQADAAVLVVDASIGSFEAGMDGHGIGQTREHAQLVRSFGVEQIIVAVNKMDVVAYAKERYDFIKSQLGSFLRSCGFKESSIIWIPLSVIENQNMVTNATDARLSCWYRGSCLLDAIDFMQPSLRDLSKPLVIPVCDVIKSHSLGPVAACGKLESGAIQLGSKVLIMPSGELATVRAIERDSCACNIARAGDNVAVGLQGIDAGHVIAGGVLCHPDFPIRVASRLQLKVLVLDITVPILVGSQIVLHIHHAKEAARVIKIVSVINQKTGKTTKTAPRFLAAKQSALIEVALDGEVCVEEFSNCRALGRVFLRSSGSTIAVGIVSRIIEQ